MPVVVPLESLSAPPLKPVTDIECHLYSAAALQGLDDASLERVEAETDTIYEQFLGQRTRIASEMKRRTEERVVEEQRRLDAEISAAEVEAKRIAGERRRLDTEAKMNAEKASQLVARRAALSVKTS